LGKGFDLAKLSTGDWFAVIELAINAVGFLLDQTSQEAKDAKISADYQAKITSELNVQKNLLQQINNLYQQEEAILRQDQAIKYQTSAILKKEIKDTEDLLKSKQDALAVDQQSLDANNAANRAKIADYTGDINHNNEMIAYYTKMKGTKGFGNAEAEINRLNEANIIAQQRINEAQSAITDTNSSIITDNSNIVDLKAQILDLTEKAKVADDQLALTTEGKQQALLEAQTVSLKTNASKAANEQAIENSLLQDQLSNTIDQNDKLDLQTQIQQKQNDLAAKRLDYQTKLNGALQDQINLGLIDIQSYAGIGRLQNNLTNMGVTGLAQATQLNSLGVRNDRITSIGSISVTNQEANLNSLTGSIGAAINARL